MSNLKHILLLFFGCSCVLDTAGKDSVDWLRYSYSDGTRLESNFRLIVVTIEGKCNSVQIHVETDKSSMEERARDGLE